MKFEPHPKADEQCRSAITLIKAILPLDLYPAHKRRFLSNGLWKLTEAEGRTKYHLRHCSQAALNSLAKGRVKRLRHEHVYRRKELVDRLIAHPDQADTIIADAIACVVTKAEHDRLAKVDRKNPEIDGWDRYTQAEIKVIELVPYAGIRSPAVSPNHGIN